MRITLPANDFGSAASAGLPASPVCTTSVVGLVKISEPVLPTAPFGDAGQDVLGVSPSATRITRLSVGVLIGVRQPVLGEGGRLHDVHQATVAGRVDRDDHLHLRFGADRDFLTAPVVRSATGAVLLSGPMISPLVLSRQPCMTPGAGQAWERFGRQRRRGGVEVGPGAISGAVVNGCEIASLNRAQPDADRRRAQRGQHPGRLRALACPTGVRTGRPGSPRARPQARGPARDPGP